MHTVVTAIHVFAALFLIAVVLLQTGKSGMGAAFGGSSTGVFGARGAGNFLTKLTAICATLFMLTSMTLSIMSSRSASVVQGHAKLPPVDNKTANLENAKPPAATSPAATPAVTPAKSEATSQPVK